jgi:hypothetical protein
MFRLDGSAEASRQVPFVKDFFFITWNLLPFLIVAIIRLAEFRLIRSIYFGTPQNCWDSAVAVVSRTVNSLYTLRFRIFYTILALALATIGCYQQYVKVHLWESQRIPDSVYWWQSQFSQTVFYTRLITLFLVLFSTIFAFTAISLLLISYIRLCRAKYWKLNLLHPDGCGGLVEYGKASLAFTLIPFLAAMCGFLGYLDHRGQGVIQQAGDVVMLVLATILGALTVFVPLTTIHRGMKEEKERNCHKLQELIRNLGPVLPSIDAERLDPESFDNLRRLNTLLETQLYYSRAPTWPLNIAIWARVVGTVAGPLAALVIKVVLPPLLTK